jgi:alpha-tubulin suppressor-like RCC1 family protein
LGYSNTDTIGDNEPPSAAGDVDVGAPVVRLSVGSARHICALLEAGRVRCWGFGAYGQLGYGNTQDIGDDETPASAGDVPLPGAAVAIAVGQDKTCALLDGGNLICWGANFNAQLGIPTLSSGCFSCAQNCCLGDDERLASAAAIDIGGPVVQMAAGSFHVCALLVTGGVRCWGSGGYGALGYGNTMTIGDDESPRAAGDVPVF